MYYIIDYENLWQLTDEELSHVADVSVNEQGVAQYDLIHVTSRDRDSIRRLHDDAISKFVAKEGNICKYAYQTSTQNGSTVITPRLQIYVPDMDEASEAPALAEITRYIVFYACASHLGPRRPDRAQQYVELSQAALDKANLLLKTRKSPTESWS